VYNIKEKCYQPPLCYDFSGVENFLGSPLIREALGVGNASWESCNNHVSYNFRGDFMRNYAGVVEVNLLSAV
jgi:predicted molibdopterin-dependent oxidoreductase YjgC